MEELDIKEIWQTQKLSAPDLEALELEEMLRNRSQSIVDKLKNFARIEHIANIIVGALMIAYFVYQRDYTFSAVLLVFLIFIIAYYKRLYNKLYAIQPTADVHIYLLEVHRELKDFIRKYQISLTILFTLAFGLGLYLGSKDTSILERLGNPRVLIKVLGIYAVSISACFVIIHFTYGQKERKIRSLIKELE